MCQANVQCPFAICLIYSSPSHPTRKVIGQYGWKAANWRGSIDESLASSASKAHNEPYRESKRNDSSRIVDADLVNQEHGAPVR